MAVINTCDALTGWTGTDRSIDTDDKMEGTGSLKDTIASPTIDTIYNTIYQPDGTWDWSAKKHILFWFKCNIANTAFTSASTRFIDTSNNWVGWNLIFSAGEWTAMKELRLDGGDDGSGTIDWALMDRIQFRFLTADPAPAFYVKIDNVWVSRQPYDSSLFMTMDMKL